MHLSIGESRDRGRKRLVRCWMLLTTLALTPALLPAQNYSERQVLHAAAQGEGFAGMQFGGAVAIDGDLAVVSELHLGAVTQLRGYRRVGGSWQNAPELSRRQSDESFAAMALSDGNLVYSVTHIPTNSRILRVLRATATGWVQDFAMSSGTGDLGKSVAIAGLRAVVGFPGASSSAGVAYVLEGEDDSSGGYDWTITETLIPTTPQAGAEFGHSVAIVSGAVVVGAVNEDVNSGGLLQSAGATYVFELTTPNWNQVNRLVAPTPQASGRFGNAVAISGLDEGTPDRLLVASRENSTSGRVYAYRRGTGNWVSSFTLNPPTAQTAQEFGSSLSMDGDHALIGAHAFDLGGSDTGVIYGADFNSGFTSATLLQRTDPLQEVGAVTGFAVAIDRDGPTALIGAPLADAYGNVNQGVVLMSQGSAGTPFPLLQRVFDLGQGLSNAYFGWAVSADGDALLVGAPGESVGNTSSIGAAYLFRRGPDGLYALETRWQSPQGGAVDFFGHAVAIKGDIALVGAPYVDLGGTDSGMVYVYRRTAGVWNIEAQLFSQCESTGRRAFGRRIAFDGTHAMIGGVCPPVNGGGPTNDVGVQIATRQSNGTWTFGLDTYSSRMNAGGWDNGLAIIGNPNTHGPLDGIEAGFVRSALFNGSNWVGNGPSDNGNNTPTPQGYGYGLSVDQGTLAIASYRPNTPVIVRRRSGNIFLPDASLVPNGLSTSDPTQAVAVLGDRIAVGALVHTVSVNQQGAAFLFERRQGVWQQTQRLLASNPQQHSYFASVMAFAPDATLFVGAPEESPLFPYEGALYVYALPPDLMFRDSFE
jgi:FG-GAP repeat